jgi:hypothetical protein
VSVVGVQQLAWDLEHRDGLLARWQEEADAVLRQYPISESEARAIRRHDAMWLLRAGVNPVALRNLLVIQGIAHKDMYRVGPGGEADGGDAGRQHS